MRGARLVVPALVLLASAAAGSAQERAGKARPVPGLTAPSALPPQLPRVRAADRGACFALAQRPDRTIAVLTYQLVLREVAFAVDPAAPTKEIEDKSNSLASLVVGDFDGDGTDEVLGRDLQGQPVVLVAGRAPEPAPRAAATRPEPDPRPWFSGRAHDWDGDARADLLFVSGEKVEVMRGVYAERTCGTLLDLAGTFLPPGGPITGTACDWDLDGMVDLLVSLPQRGVLWCRNEGTRKAPRFAAPSVLWPAAPGTVITSLLAFPVDDDPWPDLIVGTAAFGGDREHRVVVRMPRVDRTAQEDEELRAAETQLARLRQKAALADVGLKPDQASIFDKLAEQTRLERRIRALQWTAVPMVAQRPYLQLRARR